MLFRAIPLEFDSLGLVFLGQVSYKALTCIKGNCFILNDKLFIYVLVYFFKSNINTLLIDRLGQLKAGNKSLDIGLVTHRVHNVLRDMIMHGFSTRAIDETIPF